MFIGFLYSLFISNFDVFKNNIFKGTISSSNIYISQVGNPPSIFLIKSKHKYKQT